MSQIRDVGCGQIELKSDHYVAKRKKRHSLKNTQEYKDKIAKKRREYNATRKEHLKILRREYRLKNLEKIRQQERQRSRNK